MPANAGIQQGFAQTLDSRLRRNDKTAVRLADAYFAELRAISASASARRDSTDRTRSFARMTSKRPFTPGPPPRAALSPSLPNRTRRASGFPRPLCVRSGGLLLRWSGCSRRRSRLAGAACVPSLMAAVASLTAMGAPSFPSLHPMCPRGFSGAGGGRSGVRNDRSGFLRLGH
jgi:hypothetical protein